MKRWSTLVGVGVTLALLALALRNVDLAAVWSEIVSADLRWLLPAAVAICASYLIRTRRWQVMLAGVLPAPYPTLLRCLLLGFAANNVLPARVGEVVRAMTLRQQTGGAVSLGLATIIVERVFDGVTLLALLALALQVAPLPTDDERLRLVEVIATAVFLTALGVLIGLLVLRERAVALVGWLTQPLPEGLGQRLRQMTGSFIVGLDCLRRPLAVGQIAVLSGLVWTCEVVAYGCVAQAFGGLGLGPATYVSALLCLAVFVNLGIMVPSAPGFVGTFQFFARLALAPFGVAPAVAVGIGVVAHALQYGLVTGAGVVVLWRQHGSWRRLAQAVQPLQGSQPSLPSQIPQEVPVASGPPIVTPHDPSHR